MATTSSQDVAVPAHAGIGSTPPKHSSSKLEDQAATAALYVTNHDRQQQKEKSGQEFLNKHHRLSSAGKSHHLTSLTVRNPAESVHVG
jgi:hypothetical protein